MATLVLSAAGAALGGALMPAGVSLFGATLSGAVLGRAVGATVGRYIDEALFGASGQTRIVENTGARLADLQVTSSSEGTPIPRIFGRARLGGQIVWATRFEERVRRETNVSGGGGGGGKGGGGAPQQTTVTVDYRYYANFAVALCEGPITRLGRVWADGKEINLANYTTRLYRGDEAQLPDALIEAKQGAGNAPAYRGIAYVVFERLPLAAFGNRIPQLNFEVFRALDDVEQKITGVTLIPAAGEFVYEPAPVERDAGWGETRPENVHQLTGGSDLELALDQLQDVLPNCRAVSLFVAWFCSDLRAGSCQVRPGVETRSKATTPYGWSVAGATRDDAHLVSTIDGVPAYGGTPADRAVIAAIAELKARGFHVTFNPFLLLDVPDGNGLPDPYGGGEQAAHPWRGRITCDPAPGQPGSPDQTAAVAGEVASFVGSCTPGQFSIASGEVVYSGPAEWSWRRMVLHYAHLCALAGGVDAFLLGSELRGLTTLRDGPGSYPFVAALTQLASEVKAVLGLGTKVSYAADWSEYFGHQPADGSGDVHFHLDPLWASSDIDAVAIDCYWPLADWRDDDDHLDRAAGVHSIYDLAYLKGNIAGGEGYDWYYASAADRELQHRIPITDGAGKPWLFRYKDIRNWWREPHFDRLGGVEQSSPTPWQPQSKPFWLMEVGCPALDKGANEPNVFFDPKSSESRLPHHSRGTRDDTMQRRYLQAFFARFDPVHPDFVESDNPVSPVYGGRMVEPAMIHAYTWDARPYPAFPQNTEAWADGGNWYLGHWLNGRMGGGPLHAVIKGIMAGFGFEDFETPAVDGMMEGYVLDAIMSAREALQPLEMSYFLDSFESGGRVRFEHKGRYGALAAFGPDDLVDSGKDGEIYALTRTQETDLPRSNKLTFIDGTGDYRQAVVEARRAVGATSRVATAQLPIVLGQDQAQAIADSWLHDVWSAREQASFSLPPSQLALEPGDVVRLEAGGRELDLRITALRTGDAIEVEALSLQPHVYRAAAAPMREPKPPASRVFGPPVVVFLDVPLLRGDENPSHGYVAAYQSPWPGAVACYRSSGETGFGLAALADVPAVLGETLTALPAGPLARWDHGAVLDVQLYDGEIGSREALDVLAGGNLAALEQPDGRCEVIQFATATLIGPGSYRLSGLLRGQAGSEPHMAEMLSVGARFVLLDRGVIPVELTLDEVGLVYNWKAGPALYDIGHRSYRSYSRAFTGLGLKPLAPVHVRSERLTGGDVALRWVRRTRSGGDSWQAPEVPLGEDIEAYEVDILSAAGAVLRTLTCAGPAVVYTAAEQLADFGALPGQLALTVQQLSGSIGRGHAAHASFTF
jgi:hypothetical protein